MPRPGAAVRHRDDIAVWVAMDPRPEICILRAVGMQHEQ